MRPLCLPLIVAIASAASAAEITLRDSASVTPGVLVRLGDVATVTGAGAERLAASPLMPSPAPGTRQFLSAGAVRDLLAAQGYAASANRFRGAYRVEVTAPLGRPVERAESSASEWRPATPSPTRPDTAFRVRQPNVNDTVAVRSIARRRPNVVETDAVRTRVIDALQQVLDAQQAEDGQRLAVRGVKLSETSIKELLSLEDQPLEGGFDVLSDPAAGSLAARVWTASRGEGEAFPVVAEIVEQAMRVVAAEPIGRGVMVTASMVRVEPTPLEEVGRVAGGFTDLDDAVGKEATRAVRPGEVVSDSNVAPPVLVRRGEEVTIISGGGGVSVRMRANAKQEGRMGDLLTVETLDREERFPARVIGPRRLAVLSAGPSGASSNLGGGVQ